MGGRWFGWGLNTGLRRLNGKFEGKDGEDKCCNKTNLKHDNIGLHGRERGSLDGV